MRRFLLLCTLYIVPLYILAAPDFGPFVADTALGAGYYSAQVPDGNWRVTMTIGSKRKAGSTTVRAESRRLMVYDAVTRKGETVTRSFIVNKRTPAYVNAKGQETQVRLKDRERTKLDWDDKLTLEITGDNPQVERIALEPADCPTVYLCGNSTVTDQEYEPYCSWGQMLPLFAAEDVAVANYAESGETAEGFISRGRLAKIETLLKPGDYVFVEFGHNDQKSDSKVGHGAFYQFQYCLKQFTDIARAKGATIIFCTPTRRRHFDESGHIKDTHKDYPEAIRFMGERENIPVVDLQEMTKEWFEAMGPDESKHALLHCPAGTWPGQTKRIADDTHFSTYGAYMIARMVVNQLIAWGNSCGALFRTLPAYDHAEWHWNPSPRVNPEKPEGN